MVRSDVSAHCVSHRAGAPFVSAAYRLDVDATRDELSDAILQAARRDLPALFA